MSKRIRIVKDVGLHGLPERAEIELSYDSEGEECINVSRDSINSILIPLSCIDPSFYEEMRYKPVQGAYYYFINDRGKVDCTDWLDCQSDQLRYKFGNVYQTKAEAEAKILAVSEVLKA